MIIRRETLGSKVVEKGMLSFNLWQGRFPSSLGLQDPEGQPAPWSLSSFPFNMSRSSNGPP